MRILLLLTVSILPAAAQMKYNPFTENLDFVGIASISSALAAGPTGALQFNAGVTPNTIDVTSVVPLKASANTWTGSNNFSGASATYPMVVTTSDPGTCAVGQYYFNSSTLVTKVCSATNTWTAVGGNTTASGAYLPFPDASLAFGAATAGEAAFVIYCYDVNAPIGMSLTNAYLDISSSVASHYWGIALYDSGGNRLSGATQTGTTTGSASPQSVALGAGPITVSAGLISVCVTSDAGTGWKPFGSSASTLTGYVQPSGNPIVYRVANVSSFSGATITWPATLGAKTATTSNAAYSFPVGFAR